MNAEGGRPKTGLFKEGVKLVGVREEDAEDRE